MGERIFYCKKSENSGAITAKRVEDVKKREQKLEEEEREKKEPKNKLDNIFCAMNT